MVPTTPDPVDLLQRLTADELVGRIDHLEGKIAALRVLLWAARARERREDKAQPRALREGGPTHEK